MFLLLRVLLYVVHKFSETSVTFYCTHYISALLQKPARLRSITLLIRVYAIIEEEHPHVFVTKRAYVL